MSERHQVVYANEEVWLMNVCADALTGYSPKTPIDSDVSGVLVSRVIKFVMKALEDEGKEIADKDDLGVGELDRAIVEAAEAWHGVYARSSRSVDAAGPRAEAHRALWDAIEARHVALAPSLEDEIRELLTREGLSSTQAIVTSERVLAIFEKHKGDQ